MVFDVTLEITADSSVGASLPVHELTTDPLSSTKIRVGVPLTFTICFGSDKRLDGEPTEAHLMGRESRYCVGNAHRRLAYSYGEMAADLTHS